MAYRLLGSVEVCSGGRMLPLRGVRRQALLAVLLLWHGRAVPVERIVDAVWDQRVPGSARTQVHGMVSELRRLLPDGVIQTCPSGYLARVAPGELDLAVFEERARRGRQALAQDQPMQAAELLGSALSLWRGPVLAGLSTPLLTAEAARLAEHRLSVVEDWVTAEFTLGRHRALVAELAALVAEHPLRELLREQLMLALWHTGRAAEALAVYRDGRRLLREELGMEPGAPLRRLEQAILADDPTLRAATPGPVCQLPADPADFTGRARELAWLTEALTPHGTGATVVALSGPPLTGKSALAVHAAHLLRTRFPDGQLYADLSTDQDVLPRFLRALGVPVEGTSESERRELFRMCLADRRVLIVLDNATSAAQIRPLLPGVATSATLVTGRARLTGLPGVRLLDLDVLSLRDAHALLAVADPVAATEIITACARIPLAIRIAGARLAAHPHWTAAVLAERLRDPDHRLAELVHGDLDLSATFAATTPLTQEGGRALRRVGGLPDRPITAADAAVPGRVLEELSDARLLLATRTGYHCAPLVRLYARLLGVPSAGEAPS
ncbi:hypothetical protein F0L68_12325 [Solihabitans fulvus]|uniref:DNA-binding transcriptional activator of the SARP family n=1 Tax=Solihabitans fulvus TaxID=1892852 RepID=A0A5B2XHY7_9PSEU|nr:BTAD domain-containing putative transcriptional regulator [Solihabitans fulvus]KAA2262675.1 hypothetical protein F0L68_12325 [Solihabitans fulvus]